MNPEQEGAPSFPPPARDKPFDLGQWERNFLIGALLALALYLVEAGIAEILIGSDAVCRQALTRQRLAPNPFTACQAEWIWFMLRAAARGWVWLFNSHTPLLPAWFSMGVYYAFAGGISAPLDRISRVLLFLLVQVGTIAIISGLGYLRQFIA
jgi:hypothetical protein